MRTLPREAGIVSDDIYDVPIPEVVAEPIPDDDIVAVLAVTAYERDGTAFVMAYNDNTWGGPAETQARAALANDHYSRYGAAVRVRIPRALLAERWGDPDDRGGKS